MRVEGQLWGESTNSTIYLYIYIYDTTLDHPTDMGTVWFCRNFPKVVSGNTGRELPVKAILKSADVLSPAEGFWNSQP